MTAEQMMELADELEGCVTRSGGIDLRDPALLRKAAAVIRASAVGAGARITGASDIVDEAACLIWSELCPGLIMGDADRPHYENAAKAVLALQSEPVQPSKEPGVG